MLSDRRSLDIHNARMPGLRRYKDGVERMESTIRIRDTRVG